MTSIWQRLNPIRRRVCFATDMDAGGAAPGVTRGCTTAVITVPQTSRRYSRNELWVDAVVHIFGILFAINASLWLLAHVTGLRVVVSVSIYCAGLLTMILASAAYQLWRRGPAKEFLRRIDHAAIFLMIAATYTPFATNRLVGETGVALLAAIWLCATAGVIVKITFPRRFERLSVICYLAMGWMVLAVAKPLSATLASVDLWLLVTGGLVYSAGVIFFLAERLPFHKPVWHGFVLVAVALQFAAIAGEFAT
jgi:hemolysin III